MKDMVQKKYKALQLRKSGLSYREISSQIGVPKATVASWVQWVSLTDQQKLLLSDRLKIKQKQGRFRAGIALKARRIFREKAAYDAAEPEFKTFIQEPFFAYGLGLYSGKTSTKDETKTGGKNSSNFQFTTSDPERAQLMVKWIHQYLKTGEGDVKLRVFVYEPYRNAGCDAFWSRTMAVPLDKFNKTIFSPKHYFYKKRADYRGSLSITVSRIEVLRKVLAWQKLLIKYYKGTSGEKQDKGGSENT